MNICFTGHRPKDLLGYGADYRPIFNSIKSQLEDLLADISEDVTIITGGAQGVDQMAFWAAWHLEHDDRIAIKTVVAVPFAGQELRWKQDDVFGQRAYHKMLKMADEVVILSDNANDAVRKLDERNHWMVDNSALVIVVTPYQDIAERRGGTGNCIRYAIRTGKLYAIFDISKEVNK